jgi:hypothetical protein
LLRPIGRNRRQHAAKGGDDRVIALVRAEHEQRQATEEALPELPVVRHAAYQHDDSDGSVSGRQTFDRFRRKLAFNELAAAQAAVWVGLEEGAVVIEDAVDFVATPAAVAVPVRRIVLAATAAG